MHYLNEQEFQDSILAHADANGWLHHFLPDWMYNAAFARMKSGGMRRRRTGSDEKRWPSRGFPDLLLYHPGTGRMIVAELKTDSGVVAKAQKVWLAGFKAAGIETYVWRWADTDAIITLLQHPEP